MHGTGFITAFRSAACVILVSSASLEAGESPGPLEKYVASDDGAYAFETRKTVDLGDVKVRLLLLSSQKWQGEVWKHALLLAVPAEPAAGDGAVLIISGGGNKAGFEDRIPGDSDLAVQLAKSLRCPIAVLGQVPNQPLFGGRHEDDLIAFTFAKFLETGDPLWPLLLPMTKSAVKAMDAVSASLGKEEGLGIRRFFVTGASKRGWTAWLTAAVDKRVAAIAPMVIDMLNLRKHMPHQLETWGAYSDSIRDYTALGLPDRLDGGRGAELLGIVDPYLRRESIGVPKLIVLGTNDRYWPVDSAGLYFFDLKGPAFLHYVPNAGHGLNLTVVKTVSAFHDAVMSGGRMPALRWEWTCAEGAAGVRAGAEPAPERAALWAAVSATRDFRDAKWEVAGTAEGGRETYSFAVPPAPEGGWAAAYASFTFRNGNGAAYSICTDARVFGPARAEGKK